jgi:hypothetical protein
MTLEEMITYLSVTAKRCKADFVLVETHESIIAALRAGQAMRDGIFVPDYNGNKAELKHPWSVGEACRDWDAAIKEEDV